MKLVLTGYRIRDHKYKDSRTIIHKPDGMSEQKFQQSIRDDGYKGKLTPIYFRTK